MKNIKDFQQDFGDLLMKYTNEEVLKNDELADDYPMEHLFYEALDKCEELINYVNNYKK